MKADKRAIDQALGNFDPAVRLILLYGPDEPQARELADRFTAALAPADDPMGRVDFDKGQLSSDPASLADEAAAVSMFGGAKLIRADGVGDESAAAVDALLEAPVAGNPVIMTAGVLRGTSKLLKAVLKAPNALAFACYVPDGAAAISLVADACAARGLKPTREAVQMLAATFGADRGVLAQELEKYALYLDAEPGRETQLDAHALHEVGAAMSDSDFGALVDAVAGGNPAEVERQSTKLSQNGVAGIGQLRAVSRRFWMLTELRLAIESGRSAREAVEHFKPPVFWKDRDRITAQAANWSSKGLRQALSRILETERQIKTSGSAAQDVLSGHVLIGIARYAAGRRGRAT